MDYQNYTPQANKYLMPDGSVVTFENVEVLPADEKRADTYLKRSAQAAKWLLPDGSIVSALPIQTHFDIAKFGDLDLGNYAEFEEDGTLVLNGNATNWNDINVSLLPPISGAQAPSIVSVNSDTYLKCYAFGGSGVIVDQLSGSMEILHDYKEGSNILAHLHWSSTNSNLGNVKWQLRYMWVDRDGIFQAGQTLSLVIQTSGVAWKEQRNSFNTIVGNNHKIGSRFIWTLFRDPADVNDTYASDAAVFDFGIHYEKDTLGSRQIIDK